MADIFDPLPWLIMLPLAVYARGHFATVKESAPFWPIADVIGLAAGLLWLLLSGGLLVLLVVY